MIFLPTGLLIVLIGSGILLRSRIVLVIALVFFWVSCTPLFAEKMARLVENYAERHDVNEMPVADAIVVLSEGRSVAPGPGAISEWSDGDRFWGGVDLYFAGKAPVLIFTGGAAPWVPLAKSEGELLRAYAVRIGIPDASIKLTGRVMNTAEEAQAVARILPKGASVLLVTSAFHMLRSQVLFEREGYRVIAYPVDFIVNAGKEFGVTDLLPTAHAFLITEASWRELLGRAYYGISGKLRSFFAQ